MNILIFSWRGPRHPLAGGAEQVVHAHAKGWIKKGHKVTLFTSFSSGLPKKENIDGVEIVRGGYQYLGVQIAGFIYFLKNRKKIDLIVDQFHGLPFFAPLYTRKPKIALIQETAREVWFLNPLPMPFNFIIGLIGYLGEPFLFLFYRRVQFATGSESAKRDVSKFGVRLKNIVVWPHGVIVKKPKKDVKKEKIPTVIFLGVLSKDKGIEDALVAFSKLGKKGSFNFWVIGKEETQEYGESIRSLVKKLKLEKNVKFWGFVTLEKKFELLKRGHVLVNTSRREGWGLVNIEANAVGTPVVSYKAAGLVDSVKDGLSGVFSEENNPESLSEKVFEVVSDKEQYSKLQKGAIKWSKNFNWEKSVEISLKSLNKAVKGI